MSKIEKIVNYFFYHDFSDEMVEKVHSRLVESGDDEEKEVALENIWEEIGCPENNVQAEQAFAKVGKILGRKPADENEMPKKCSFHIPAWGRAVAIWLIPLLSIVFSYYMYKEASGFKEVAFVEHYVPEGKREQLLLPDGSNVWLNSGTLLIYPAEFTHKTREVYLAGEGYFDIEKNPEHPFIVKTRLLRVEVIGTKFNLSAYPKASRIITTLEQGEVKVLLADNEGMPYYLKPDEQLIYLPETGNVKREVVSAESSSDWKEGGLLFNNTPFNDLLEMLERVYNVNVHLQTSAYYSNRLTIHFNKNESLENVMMLIKEMIPGLEYQIEGENIYLK
mgnify:CR=1 FL=1